MGDGVGADWDFVDEIDINDVIDVTEVNAVIAVNLVIIDLSHKFLSQLPAEGLVQQRLLQRRQRRELLLVELGEALGFLVEGV